MDNSSTFVNTYQNGAPFAVPASETPSAEVALDVTTSSTTPVLYSGSINQNDAAPSSYCGKIASCCGWTGIVLGATIAGAIILAPPVLVGVFVGLNGGGVAGTAIAVTGTAITEALFCMPAFGGADCCRR